MSWRLKYPQLRPVDHEVKPGYGAVVFTALSSAKTFFLHRPDRQFILEEIDLLAERLNEAEMVVGYRFCRDPFTWVLFGHGWTRWLPAAVWLLWTGSTGNVQASAPPHLQCRGTLITWRDFQRGVAGAFQASWLHFRRGGGQPSAAPVGCTDRRASDVIKRLWRALRFRVRLWNLRKP